MDGEKKPFIREHIRNRTRGSGRIFRNMVKIIASAVLFGLIAVCTIVLAGPAASRLLGEKEETTTAQAVIIKRDEPETVPPAPTAVTPAAAGTDSAVPPFPGEPDMKPGKDQGTAPGKENGENRESGSGSEAEAESESGPESGSESGPEFREVRDMVQDALQGYKYSMNDLTVLWKNVSGLCDTVDPSVVMVRSVKKGVDWFDNALEKDSSYSGIIIAETDTELLILTMEEAVNGTDQIKVDFITGTEADCELKGSDSMSGLTVLSVKKADIDFETGKQCVPVALGNSYLIDRGDLLIGVGSPKSVVHSIQYTWVSYIEENVGVIDGNVLVLATNDEVDGGNGTWLLNTKGELVGWATDRIRKGPGNGYAVGGISDYKGLLEDLLNGKSSAYIGLAVADIDDCMQEEGMPDGAYILEVETDGPAYEAGVQPGDILTRIGENEITGVRGYESALDKLNGDEEVVLTISRSGRDEYKEIEYPITVMNRLGREK